MEELEAYASRVWPELEIMARPARDRRRLEPETRSRIIVQLCAHAPLSVKELSQLLARSEAYVGDAIRPLVNDGLISFLYPDQPRHPRQKYVAGEWSRVRPDGGNTRAGDDAASSPVVEPLAVARESLVQSVEAAQPKAEAPAAPAVADEPAGAGLPNAWTNAAVVIVAGVALALWGLSAWPVLAALVALGLASLHVLTRSQQLRQFRELHRGRASDVAFVLLKAGVALAEIVVVYLATRALSG